MSTRDDLKKSQKAERKGTSLLRAPLYTVKILFLSLYEDLLQGILFFNQHVKTLIMALILVAVISILFVTPGPHEQYVSKIQGFAYLTSWWIILGVLSSVGLGTGLHTFLLYLGPFIAQVTLAATECKSTNFDRYGPNRFLCPQNDSATNFTPLLTDILPLVWFESFLWGAGTALGELPPYFLARAAKQSGKRLEELEDHNDEEEESSSLMNRLNEYMDTFLKKYFVTKGVPVKFIIIMLFASIPNPLFDLAGLTCGYQLVPFMLFFLPTLIGKGVIKVTIQSLFVITVFKKDTLEFILSIIQNWVPFLKDFLQKKFDEVRLQFHRMPGEGEVSNQKPSLAIIWDIILALMVGYFIVSLVDYKVQNYLVKEHLKQIKLLEEKVLGNPNPNKKND